MYSRGIQSPSSAIKGAPHPKLPLAQTASIEDPAVIQKILAHLDEKVVSAASGHEAGSPAAVMLELGPQSGLIGDGLSHGKQKSLALRNEMVKR